MNFFLALLVGLVYAERKPYGKKQPFIAVVGSTGQQGGSVVDALLADGTFAVRCLTRNINSEKAIALHAKGCMLHAADLDDIISLESAFEGPQLPSVCHFRIRTVFLSM